MSFLGLSREARNFIHHALLCPPDGVYLQSDAHRWAWASSNRYGDSGEDEEEEDDGKDISQREKRSPTAPAAIPVSTAIFYVSHQIHKRQAKFSKASIDLHSTVPTPRWNTWKIRGPASDIISKTLLSRVGPHALMMEIPHNSGNLFVNSSIATCFLNL